MRDAAAATAARALARDVAGPPDPALRRAGQAVIVDAPAARATLGVSTADCVDGQARTVACPSPAAITAYAAARRLGVASAGDPRLRQFIEYWLGRAAG